MRDQIPPEHPLFPSLLWRTLVTVVDSADPSQLDQALHDSELLLKATADSSQNESQALVYLRLIVLARCDRFFEALDLAVSCFQTASEDAQADASKIELVTSCIFGLVNILIRKKMHGMQVVGNLHLLNHPLACSQCTGGLVQPKTNSIGFACVFCFL